MADAGGVQRAVVWGTLLGYSVAFNLLANADHYTDAHAIRGEKLMVAGKLPEAIVQYEQALRIKPDYADAQNALARLEAGQ